MLYGAAVAKSLVIPVLVPLLICISQHFYLVIFILYFIHLWLLSFSFGQNKNYPTFY